MGLTGKYDFKNIKRLGAAGIRTALLASPYTAWMSKYNVISDLFDLIWEGITNWMANQGLIVLNIGAIFVEGELDQHQLDSQMDNALSEITEKGGRDKLTPEQKKAIDDEVIKAARKFIVIGGKHK